MQKRRNRQPFGADVADLHILLAARRFDRVLFPGPRGGALDVADTDIVRRFQRLDHRVSYVAFGQHR